MGDLAELRSHWLLRVNKETYQKRFSESDLGADLACFEPGYELSAHPNIMMALALQNRFIVFDDWFSREIKDGALSVEDIAASVFTRL